MSAAKSATSNHRVPAGQGGKVHRDDPQDDPGGWKREFKDLMRAIAAGAIIGMPLLYTMEMWWHGTALSEWHILSLLAVTLVLNFGFDLISGFREDYSIAGALNEAVTSVGIGIVFSATILWLIGELNLNSSPVENIGKILIESSVISVGVSFANSQVRKQSRTGDDEGKEDSEEKADGKEKTGKGEAGEQRQRAGMHEDDPERAQLLADLRDAGATLAGSTVFALNVAPTEEIIMIAARLSAWQLLALLGSSLLLCYIILFASGFEDHKVHVESLLQNPLAEVVMASAMSLIVAFVLLLLFGQRHVLTDPSLLTAAVVVLGLPAIVGGAAGRIIV